MIKTPYIFSKVKRKSLPTDTTFGCEISLKVSPEPFKTIYMSALFIRKLLFIMFYKTVHIPFSCNASITSPGIRINSRATFYLLLDQWQKGLCLYIRDYLSPHISSTTIYSKHWLLLTCSTSSLSSFDPVCLPFIPPSTPNIGLINFYLTIKNFRNIPEHRLSCYIQSPKNSSLVKSSLKSYFIATKSQHKISQYLPPLILGKPERQFIRNPFILTFTTFKFSSPDFPLFDIITPRTFAISYATILYLWWLKWYFTLNLFHSPIPYTF